VAASPTAWRNGRGGVLVARRGGGASLGMRGMKAVAGFASRQEREPQHTAEQHRRVGADLCGAECGGHDLQELKGEDD
jgi:hypothetical protein